MGKMASIKGVPFVVHSDDSDSRCMSLKDIPAEDRVNSSDDPILQMIEEPFNAAMWAIAEDETTTAEKTMAVFEQCCGISRPCNRNKKASASVRSYDKEQIGAFVACTNALHRIELFFPACYNKAQETTGAAGRRLFKSLEVRTN